MSEQLGPPQELEPTFNPTNAPESEVYARGVQLDPERGLGWKPHSELTDSREMVDVWRLEQRERVANGLGLIASRIALDGTIGDVENFKLTKHLASNHEKRSDPEKATPFVSFSTDPEYLAKQLILRHGFGIKEGVDSVIVKAKVHPDRLFAPSADKQPEVLLVGGLSPEEYETTHEVTDFVNAHAAEQDIIDTRAGEMTRDAALEHWRTVPSQLPPAQKAA